ncbi:MAG TPA: dihydrodipicolinate synthase family protein [Rugosimonospora sp.]|nr:dihydrodipicolinate synthase family protein [Rugosimonospora sp.]
MSLEQVRAALESVVAITVTPFDGTGGVDTAAYASIVDRCVTAGVTAVTPNGNTSEFYSLNPDELALAVETTAAALGGRATLIAGVGHDAARAARDARQAEQAGAQAVMVHQPVHPYQSQEGWVDYHRTVAEAVPDLGVVCYARSPHLTAAAFAALADRCPNVVGVKYAVPDVVALPDLVRAVGPERWVWVCGLAETWAPYFWLAGARGFTSGLANVAPAESLALLAALRGGDYPAAMAIWSRLRPFEDMRARAASAANVSVVKEALHQLGLCRPDVRPPISRLEAADRDQVAKILSELST